MDLDKLTITDVRDGIPGGAGSGDTVYFTYDGVQYRYESWSTDSSSGSDMYQLSERTDEDGEVHSTWIATLSLDEDDREELEVHLDESVLPTWWDAWREYVEPARTLAVRATLERLAEDKATV